MSGPIDLLDGGADADRPDGEGVDDRDLREAFARGDLPVAIYGLGKMGLPLAAVYAETCGTVVGVDVDPDVADAVNRGECHVTGEPGLPELVADQVDRGRLEATTDGSAAAAEAAVHVIIVPTLLAEGREPDLSLIEAVCADVAAGLSPGDLVIAESTLPPGTCREVVRPALADESGLEPDAFGVAFCPERTSSGTALRDIRGRYPKVVGGVDDGSARAAAAIYDELSENEVRVVADATTAEAVKVFEGVYRDVNIALANELARASEDIGISAREAFATANQLPMCDLHDPGPGVGGHCIPYYPHFVRTRTDEEMPLVETARSVNDGMPAYAVSLLERELAAIGEDLAGASVLVLGLTYRPGVEETRASPALGVLDRLRECGADVHAVDPLVDPADYGATPVAIEQLPERAFDAAVVVTPHEEFDRIDWDRLEPMVVVDGRDALDRSVEQRHRVRTLGGRKRAPGANPRVAEGGSESIDESSRGEPTDRTPESARGETDVRG